MKDDDITMWFWIISIIAFLIFFIWCALANAAEYTVYIENEELIKNHMDLPGFDGMLWEDAGDKKEVQW